MLAVDLPPKALRAVPAADLAVQVVELDTGHDVMISAPALLAEVLGALVPT